MLGYSQRSLTQLFGLLLLTIVLTGCAHSNAPTSNLVVVGNSAAKVTTLLSKVVQPAQAQQQSAAQIIDRVSASFMGTPYTAHTLIGSNVSPEKLVIDLKGVDCFTFIDYVIALSESNNYQDFIHHLTQTRYIDGVIDYKTRRHFFSDWVDNTPYNATDITTQVSPNSITVTKFLNRQANGAPLLAGVPIVKRSVTFIPAQDITQAVVNRLKTGDLIGIYTPIPGLDVTHVGLFIMTPQGPMFRNASSLQKNRQVVDSPFLDYVKNTPGIVVYQPKLLSDSPLKLNSEK